MYGKLFSQMYDGTLATKGPWQALVTFQQLVILADQDGIVDMTPEAIVRRTTVPLKIIQEGLRHLQEPDPESRTPDEEGRRITLLSESRGWGWRIVNHGHYRKLRNGEERREYHRKYYRDKRKPQRASTLSTVSTSSTDSTKAVSRSINTCPLIAVCLQFLTAGNQNRKPCKPCMQRPGLTHDRTSRRLSTFAVRSTTAMRTSTPRSRNAFAKTGQSCAANLCHAPTGLRSDLHPSRSARSPGHPPV